jgi:hypothetical protein
MQGGWGSYAVPPSGLTVPAVAGLLGWCERRSWLAGGGFKRSFKEVFSEAGNVT